MKKRNYKLYTKYIGYVKTDNKQGFIDLLQGQGETLICLVEDLDEAWGFDSRQQAIDYIKADGEFNPNKVKFYTRTTTIIEEYSEYEGNE